MGVPFLFSFLLGECPEMIKEVIPSSSESNNKIPTDHLYLDMNGIVHTFKDTNLQTKLLERLLVSNTTTTNTTINNQKEEQLKQTMHEGSFEQNNEEPISVMMERFIFSILLYLEEVIYRFTPTKTLYFALDGSSPCAKMNQQRERRWISFNNHSGLPKRHCQHTQQHGNNREEKNKVVHEESLFDSISITSGTRFMKDLSEHLQFFIKRKLQDDPQWRNIENIIFSDSSVFGEGEHKIMSHIRQVQQIPNRKSEKFMIYGMDSDLILLPLVTHEENIYVLRDWMPSVSDSFNQVYSRWKIKRNFKKKANSSRTVDKDRFDHKFHLVEISLVRKLIEKYMRQDNPNVQFDLNRVIDDFILMLFVCGNDFISSLPTLDIGKDENALGYLFKVYRTLFSNVFKGSYITNSSNSSELINLERLEIFMQVIGRLEVRVLSNRLKKELQLINEKKTIEEKSKKSKEQSTTEEEIKSKAGHQNDNDIEVVKSTLNNEHFKNLLAIIDLEKSMALNSDVEMKRFLMLSSVTATISGKFNSTVVATSNIDSEIMFDIPFKQPLSLCSLLIRMNSLTSKDLEGISIKLFINQTVDFVSMESHKVAQEFKGKDVIESIQSSGCELKLKLSAFQNVSKLSIIIENQVNTSMKTSVEQLVIFGNVSTKTGSKLVKVSKKNWKKKDYKQKAHNLSFEFHQEEERVKKFKVLTASISLKKKEGMPPPPYIDIEKWKCTYYKRKLNITYDNSIKGGGNQVRELVKEYIKAMYWTFYYYYFGVPSWEWFYNYHYAPAASDFVNLKELFTEMSSFRKGTPLNPIESLLSVIPLHKTKLIHECLYTDQEKQMLSQLISSQNSVIYDLYYHKKDDNNHYTIEEDLDIDPNDEGLKNSLKDPFYHYSRMVVHLPFVNIENIRKACDSLLISQQTRRENTKQPNNLYFKWIPSLEKGRFIKSTLSILPDINDSLVSIIAEPFQNNENEIIQIRFL